MDRPILFSAPMVRAILDGKKTQTRRAIKNVGGAFIGTVDRGGPRYWFGDDARITDGPRTSIEVRCPYGQPGDRLYVRETWGRDQADNGGDRHWNRVVYRADPGAQALDNGTPVPWTPSIHMPRWASRITLEITGVRVERLQDISEADAADEGVERYADGIGWKRGPIEGDQNLVDRTAFAKLAYRSLWEQINGPGSWVANPWVWVVEFKRVTP